MRDLAHGLVNDGGMVPPQKIKNADFFCVGHVFFFLTTLTFLDLRSAMAWETDFFLEIRFHWFVGIHLGIQSPAEVLPLHIFRFLSIEWQRRRRR